MSFRTIRARLISGTALALAAGGAIVGLTVPGGPSLAVLVGFAIAAAVALATTVLLARGIAGPIERLTALAETSGERRVFAVEGPQEVEPRRRVSADGVEVPLKPKEFDLLAFLAAHPGRVFAREQILARVWGFDYAGDSRTVDTRVKTLREKLGDRAERPRWIETVRGVGYRFREDTA